MTTRVKAVVVTLEQDFREDDLADLLKALCMIRGVVSADVVHTNIGDYVARERVRAEARGILYKAIEDALNPQGPRPKETP